MYYSFCTYSACEELSKEGVYLWRSRRNSVPPRFPHLLARLVPHDGRGSNNEGVHSGRCPHPGSRPRVPDGVTDLSADVEDGVTGFDSTGLWTTFFKLKLFGALGIFKMGKTNELAKP